MLMTSNDYVNRAFIVGTLRIRKEILEELYEVLDPIAVSGASVYQHAILWRDVQKDGNSFINIDEANYQFMHIIVGLA